MDEIKIYLKTSGSIAMLDKDFSLYQGSYRNVQLTLYVPKILLYQNVDGTYQNAVKTGAILTTPNGAKVTTFSYPADYVKTTTVNGVEYAVYSQIMPKEFTLYAGTQTIVCNVVSIDSTNASSPKIVSITTTQEAQLLVLESAYLDSDKPLEPSESEIIEALINGLRVQLDYGYFGARALYAWNSEYTYGANEIVFYPDKGEYGTFIKSLIANNDNAPYSEGVLNSDYWEEITDFNILNELYSLKEELQAALEASQLNAEAAADSLQGAQQSAENAEAAAQRVESAAEYIESVQDGTTAVPKATADETGANIADQFSTVNSDIAGLREDITNEAHFRGMFDSVDALEAAYPTATPNDYAYIVGGNIWIYNTDGGWADSGEPSPNTAVPASDSVPLMDGEGSAGTSSQYARGDHRHPTDTTRASEADLASETTRAKAEEAKKANLDGAAFTGDISATTVTGTNGVYDGEARVYSPNNPPHVLSRTTEYKIFPHVYAGADDNLGLQLGDSSDSEYWDLSIMGTVTATHYFYSDNPKNPISTDIHITARIFSLSTNTSDRVYGFIDESSLLQRMNWSFLNFDWQNTRVKVFADDGYLTPNFYGPTTREYAGYTGFHLNSERHYFSGSWYQTLIIGRVYNSNGAFGAWGTESPIYNDNSNRVFEIDIFGAKVVRR
ncbi:MAG: hypothetical protein K2K60_03070 [Clostridia bacterium]|nr:hypothetical protein [Clostridia bacterium]